MRFKAILFLTLQIAVLLQPLSPYVDYYMNEDYIREFLCQNKNEPASITVCAGKCYLADMLAEKHEDNPSETTLLKSIGALIAGPERIILKELSRSDYVERDYTLPPVTQYGFLPVYDVFHPPRIS